MHRKMPPPVGSSPKVALRGRPKWFLQREEARVRPELLQLKAAARAIQT
jgi:hypothetical protein